MCRCPNNTLNSPLTQPIRLEFWNALRYCRRVFHCIALAAWTRSCKLKFVFVPRNHYISNALSQYFRLILSNELLPHAHQAANAWLLTRVACSCSAAISYCSQSGVGRKPGGGQVTFSPVTLVLDRVLGPFWTKEKFCEGWKTVRILWRVLFKSAPTQVNVSSLQWLTRYAKLGCAWSR